MANLPNSTTGTFSRWWTHFSRSKAQPSPQEEQEQILKRGERFERLTAEPGFSEIMDFLAEHVNNAILDAATSPVDNPYLKTVHVMRWDAKRELLDAARNYVEETLRLKADIVKEMRRTEDEL